MLVFCEDCGCKNDIDPQSVKENNNRYRCLSCNFLNQLITPKSSPKESAPKPVRKQLNKPPTSPPKKAVKKTNTDKSLFGESPYLELIKQISSWRDIRCCCVLEPSKRVIAAKTTKHFPPEAMLKIGTTLSFCLSIGERIIKDGKDTYMALDNGVVIAKKLRNNHLLLIFSRSYPLAPGTDDTLKQTLNDLSFN